MRRIICVILALVLLCGAESVRAFAADGTVEARCDEQAFTISLPSGKEGAWEDDVGFRVFVRSKGYVPYITVYRRTGEHRFKNPVNYLNNVYREFMEESYDNKVSTNPCADYDIGGKTLLAAHYHYEVNGNKLVVSLMIELREDGDVEYLAKYPENDPSDTLKLLDTVVRSYRPDGAEAPEPAVADGLADVRCDEQGYSTKMPAGLSYTWQEGNGLRIWGDEPGYVPNVLIWRRPTKLNDPQKYVQEVYPNYMKETYGENLVSYALHEYYDVGGKRLLGETYIYRGSSGALINQIHLVEVRGDGDVEYNTRFLNSEREATLEILEAAVRYYTPDGAVSAQTPTSAQPTPAVNSGTKQLNAVAAQPIVSGTEEVSDSRFSMKIPKGWKIMTEGEFMTFSFKVWDPANPDRTIFFLMKMEPFLKSEAARQKYKQVNDSLGGNSIYMISAYAPVMESCTLKGVLDSIPQVYDFCERFYDAKLTLDPSVLPQISNPQIIEKTKSSLPAPADCGENVIGRITFEDYLGQKCEGLVTAQPINTPYVDFFGVDGWPYTVYIFMGVTAPLGELSELEPVLTECLGSFGFTQSYVRQAIDLSNAETQALLEQARTMQAAHDAMVDAWYAREKSHDISFQKWSDGFMGYDRLYDSATGEVYLAETGFYDSYDLHRGEYANSNLHIVDKSSEDYYLKGADYYITK
ncbi:MAG: hypothetical protein K5663_06420 [Clostridiales bacterium]|nr:hypothetical protein [Clostridiales bacterium]